MENFCECGNGPSGSMKSLVNYRVAVQLVVY
jgi:hypothetical protein